MDFHLDPSPAVSFNLPPHRARSFLFTDSTPLMPLLLLLLFISIITIIQHNLHSARLIGHTDDHDGSIVMPNPLGKT